MLLLLLLLLFVLLALLPLAQPTEGMVVMFSVRPFSTAAATAWFAS
jgi:hypothetical protein